MIDGEELATLVENSVLLHDYVIPQADELPAYTGHALRNPSLLSMNIF